MTDAERTRLVAGWWHRLQPRPDGGGGDRGALARLRRCATAADAAMEPATLDLARQVGAGWLGLGRVAVAAAVLAHVREDVRGASAARQLGPGPTGTAMSWLRFRRLLQAGTEDELVTAFRRAVALAGGRMNVPDLAGSLLNWNDERRRRWVMEYHNAPATAGQGSTPA
jgi:CRISPR system Cascade subunit CasB